MARTNVVTDVLGVMLAIGVAYLLAAIGDNPTVEIDSTELIRTVLLIGSIAGAVGFVRQTVVDSAELLRGNAHES